MLWKATRSRHLHHGSPLMTHKHTGPSAAVMQRINKCTHVAHASAENRSIPVLQHLYGCSKEKGKEHETEWVQNHPLFSNYQHFFKKMTDIGEVDGKWPLWKRQCTGRQQPRAIWERAARDVNTFCSVKWPITVKPFGLPCCGGRRHRALYCNPHISQARNTCCTPFKNNEYPV